MEPHHHDQQENSGRNNSVAGSRQTSTRWTPTGEQIRILKELFYNNEIRSPSAEQIHRITARLRQYGRIEGKNVFYWFQNHKARHRAKKKSPANTTMPMHHKNPHYQHFHGASSSSSALSTVGRMGSNNMSCGYGSTVMDNSFGEDSSNSSSGGEQYPSFDRTNPMQFFSEGYTSTVIETLPLFPMHGDEEEEEEEEDEDENGGSSFGYYTGNPNQNGAWYGSENGWMLGSRASLELSLNSYSFN